MILHIQGDRLTTIYNEKLDLSVLGSSTIKRASYVEPTVKGRWEASIIGGPVLGPFDKRSQALAAEVEWLEINL